MIGMDGRMLAAEVMEDDAAEEVDRRAGELFDARNRDPRRCPARASCSIAWTGWT